LQIHHPTLEDVLVEQMGSPSGGADSAREN